MREFNTSGPVVPEDHYCIPPLDRMDLDYVLQLIRAKKYFILHAPRQTGKTSALLALQDLLNSGSEGSYRCLYVNLEAGGAARENVREAMIAILNEIGSRARSVLGDDFVGRTKGDSLDTGGPYGALMDVLNRWAEDDSRALVLLIDEIDSLVGDTLLSVLRQLRSGYDRRPASFPHTIVLCGVRDLRDYRTRASSEAEPVAGGSAFNISAASLRLGDFSRAEVEQLLVQHTAETGQQFLPSAIDRVWTQTQGQPWLVNALCGSACFPPGQQHSPTLTITEEDIMEEQEHLIRKRAVHLDQLADKLQEDRVRRVIEPLLTGTETTVFSDRDLEYVRDLGLIARDDPLRIANPIYTEVVARQLTYAVQAGLPIQTARFVDAEGGLDLPRLLEDFRDSFRQHSEHWGQRFLGYEAGPQLLLQAYLQKVVNSGGQVEREYGLGRGRTDLLVVWPQGGSKRRYVVECKIFRDGLERVIREGVEQTAGYMDRCGAESGHLVLFASGEGTWKDKLFRGRETFGEATVEVWGM